MSHSKKGIFKADWVMWMYCTTWELNQQTHHGDHAHSFKQNINNHYTIPLLKPSYVSGTR